MASRTELAEVLAVLGAKQLDPTQLLRVNVFQHLLDSITHVPFTRNRSPGQEGAGRTDPHGHVLQLLIDVHAVSGAREIVSSRIEALFRKRRGRRSAAVERVLQESDGIADRQLSTIVDVQRVLTRRRRAVALTCEEVGEKYEGISKSAVQAAEARAIKNLKRYLRLEPED